METSNYYVYYYYYYFFTFTFRSWVTLQITYFFYTAAEDLVFADLQWFNISPFCRDAEVYSRVWRHSRVHRAHFLQHPTTLSNLKLSVRNGETLLFSLVLNAVNEWTFNAVECGGFSYAFFFSGSWSLICASVRL